MAKIGHTFVITGRPAIQKNRHKIVRVRGQARIIKNKAALEWHKEAAAQLAEQLATTCAGFEPIRKGNMVNVEIWAYCGKGTLPDADNLACAPLDALQKAGILENDSSVEDLHIYRRRDRDNPRVEVTIYEKL